MLLYLEHTLRDDFGELHIVKSIKDKPKDKSYSDTSTNTIFVYKPKKAFSHCLLAAELEYMYLNFYCNTHYPQRWGK